MKTKQAEDEAEDVAEMIANNYKAGHLNHKNESCLMICSVFPVCHLVCCQNQ